MKTLQSYLFLTFLLGFGQNVVSKKETDKIEFVKFGNKKNTGFKLDKDIKPTRNLSAILGTFSARSTIPKSYDWRKHYLYNVLPPVEDQNPCMVCWAFSTLYMLEAQYAIETGETVSFSKQQLVDCNKDDDGLGGCKGWGTIRKAFDYVKKYGMMTTKAYGPYVGKDEKCKYDPKKVVAYAKDLIFFAGHEAFLKVLINRGPIGATMIWTGSYKGGVLSIKGDQCPEAKHPINHMVLIVGYGKTSKGLKYWIVKNTYGPNFGIQKGYFKVERGRNTLCIEKVGAIAKIDLKKPKKVNTRMDDEFDHERNDDNDDDWDSY